MRDVINAAKSGDVDCALARNLYVQRVRKYLGAFLVKLDGKLDALVFTAGVGENDKEFRELVTANLETLGIDVDASKNRALKGGGEIQSSRSRSKVLVVNTQEELSLACQSLELCGHIAKGSGLGDAPFKVHTKPDRRFTLEAGFEEPEQNGTSMTRVAVAGACALALLRIAAAFKK